MKVIICPGVHDPRLTESFVGSLKKSLKKHYDTTVDYLVFPTDKFPAYSALDVVQWLDRQNISNHEVLFICFSAGVVAGIGAAFLLQSREITIKAFIALDGWGVPLWANFPVYRLSHDYFTHWSSAILGTGKSSFYCDPSVEHLTLWESPDICRGKIFRLDIRQLNDETKCSATDYLKSILVEILDKE